MESYFPQPENHKALDIGTGTGTCAFFLEIEGFCVDGIDISSKAIEIANCNSLALKSNVTFLTGDILNLENTKKYDFVTDSSCLHCVVTDDDRRKLYSAIKRVLKYDGEFFVHTWIDFPYMQKLG